MKKLPVIYTFIDPECPHCHDLIQDFRTSGFLEKGLVQLQPHSSGRLLAEFEGSGEPSWHPSTSKKTCTTIWMEKADSLWWIVCEYTRGTEKYAGHAGLETGRNSIFRI